MWSRRVRRHRTGSYAVLAALLLVILLGFASLVVDWGRVRIAAAEAQAVADASAESAVLGLKRTGTMAGASQAASLVASRNTIAGHTARLEGLEVGGWDPQERIWSGTGTNAVRVRVGRSGDSPLLLPLARLFGFPTANVQRTATAATVNLQVILAMDITGSWDKDNFYNARAAALAFLDHLHNAHSPDDIVGMTMFMQRFAWEYTPFTSVRSSSQNPALVRSKWQALNVASYAGVPQPTWESQTSKHVACRVYGTNNNGASPWAGWCTSGSSCYQPANRDKFTTPAGGCAPAMPRYYSDEGGTDHTTGMEMARTMFQERPDPFAYRALVVLTDGQPVGYGTTSGSKRVSQGHTETRYRQYLRSSGHTTGEIETDTPLLAQQMHDELGVHIWFVSFVEYRSFMEDAAQGDGYFRLATSSAELVDVFERIASSLPVTVVE